MKETLNVLIKFAEDIPGKMGELVFQAGIDIPIDMWMDVNPVPMNPGIRKKISRVG